ncbi:MAG: pirin family protein [Myxococcaceae bacterium]
MTPTDTPKDSVESVIIPPTKDLGDNFVVKRALPARHRRMVGPFVFFDQMGPAHFDEGRGLDVRPHPHIGLATVTYVFEGEILHRDSLGSVQPIRPGEVNWMIAGRGISHSERTPPAVRKSESKLSGIQVWVGLPKKDEEVAPAFSHHSAEELPVIEGEGKRLRVIAGNLMGKRSPVRVLSEMFYADLILDSSARISLEPEHEERAIYPVEGSIEIDGVEFEAGQLIILRPGMQVVISAPRTNARALLVGGAAMDGPRHVYWNFVSSDRDRIEQAKHEWRERTFPQVPGETEFIPLPEDPPPVRYP